MKRKFNHNSSLLKELYGRNFSLQSLLNEQEGKRGEKAKKAFKNILQKASNIKVSKKGETVKVSSDSTDVPDTAVSFNDAISQMKEELKDPNITPEKIQQIENISNTLSDAASADQKTQLRAINRQASKLQKKSASTDKETVSATKQGSTPQQKKKSSGNSKVRELQELIGHEPVNGVWSGTDKTWAAWVDKNKSGIPSVMPDDDKTIELIKSSWKKASAKSNGTYTGNIDGMIKFVKDFSTETTTGEGEQEPDNKDADEIEKKATGDWAKDRAKNIKDFLKKHGEVKYSQAFTDSEAINCKVGQLLTSDPGLPIDLVYTFAEFKEKKGEDSFRDIIDISTVGTMSFWPDALAVRGGNTRTITKIKNFGEESVSLPELDQGNPTTNDIYYNEALETLCYDTATGDYILGDVKLKDGFLRYVDPETNESFTRFNGMVLGESRASLYRKRYFGRY